MSPIAAPPCTVTAGPRLCPTSVNWTVPSALRGVTFAIGITKPPRPKGSGTQITVRVVGVAVAPGTGVGVGVAVGVGLEAEPPIWGVRTKSGRRGPGRYGYARERAGGDLPANDEAVFDPPVEGDLADAQEFLGGGDGDYDGVVAVGSDSGGRRLVGGNGVVGAQALTRDRVQLRRVAVCASHARS